MSLTAAKAPSRFETPRAARRGLVRALNTADLAGATACFAREGCLITPDATAIHGREAIGSVLAQLIDRGTEIETALPDCLEADGVALATERWRIRSIGAGGDPFVQESTANMVLRRIEGQWKLSILAPWGWAGAGPRSANGAEQNEAGRQG
jgi:ketosteroid isomerase-like protein